MAVDMALYEPNDTSVHELRDLPERLVTEIKNRTWWTCFMADVATESSNGKPGYAIDIKATIPLPSNERIWDLEPHELEIFDTVSKPQGMEGTDADVFPESMDFQSVFSLGVGMVRSMQ